MKKLCLSIFLTLFLGFHLSSIDLLAQSCTQLSLPEHAIARLCIPRNKYPADLDFSPDGKTLASLIYCCPREIILWDVENKIEKLTIIVPNDSYHSIRFSPDGKTFVCGNTLYDTTTGQPKLILSDSEGYENHVVYSPDGKTLAGAGVKGIRFWNSTADPTTDTSPPIGILPTDTSAIDTSKDGFVATPIATSSVTVPRIRGLSYSPDGQELAIACSLGVWIYNAELNTEITLFTQDHGGHRGGVLSVAYSPDGNTIASGDSAGKIHLWDAKSRKHKLTLSKPKIFGQYLSQIPSLKFSPDSNAIVSGSDRSNGDQMYLWDATTGEYKYTLRGHTGNVTSVIFSPDGNTIASTSSDKTILLWDFTAYPIVSISPDSVTPSTIGEELTFDLKITNSKDISGYQATIEFDPEAFEYIETTYGDYLSEGVPVQPILNQHLGTVKLASLSLSGIGSNGDGTLATIKFKVNAIRTSKLSLRDVILSDNEGNESYAWIDGAQILKTATTEDSDCSVTNTKDVNKDCVVNIQDLVLVATHFGRGGGNVADVNSDGRVDIIDLVLVAGAFGDTATAPAVYADTQAMITTDDVQQWLRAAHKVNLPDSMYQRGMLTLEQLLTVLIPKNTALLPNYPNPFNPETWIPYQLVEPAEVTVLIYSANGPLIRTLALGHQPAGIYRNRDRAAYWDGTNEAGEPVASGVYFYTLLAGDFRATRRMLVIK
ncbi:hypothetical protein C6503_25510 [Candidatus Poribacteria bacterium]|nr:MAG: hypothetical protein C6503_25510 [Candidatus Poribacteria bacterium]